jgi:hypothetical protein
MFEELQNFDLSPMTVYGLFANLGVALVCGLIISLTYRYIYKGPSFSATYVNSLVLLSLITSVVIMVIGNNLARAFGLVGAMSIIRFRTAVRDVQDIVFIFFALVSGMASGVGLHAVAIGGTVMICLVAFILVTFNFGDAGKTEFVLHLVYSASGPSGQVIKALLKKYCRKVKLVSVKNLGDQTKLEAFYHFSLKRLHNSEELVGELSAHPEQISFNLYFDHDEPNMNF